VVRISLWFWVWCFYLYVPPEDRDRILSHKNRRMDNVQKHNNCINIPSSQTFRARNQIGVKKHRFSSHYQNICYCTRNFTNYMPMRIILSSVFISLHTYCHY
jgi:hypothetical protein